jgi:hypothetical protein
MPAVIKNLYKASGLFNCHHPAHKQFGYEVSPYHVFFVKKCHPAGCVEFLWRCRKFEKGHVCPRGFKHVGRGCFSCKQYHENKISYVPETNMDANQVRDFIDDLREYRGWLESMNGKSVEFAGVVDAIRPHLVMRLDSNRSAVSMDGFYASFERGHLGRDLFDGRIYLKIPGSLLEKTAMAPGDKVDLSAIFSESRGRIIMHRPRRLEISGSGRESHISVSRALVGRATGKIIASSIEYCNGCPYCSLVDVEDMSRQQPLRYRRFYCLRGVGDSENCPIRLEKLLPLREERQRVRRF